MKKFISIVTCLAVLLSMATLLAACDNKQTPTTTPPTPTTTAHTHSYGSEWKSDATNHWNECACGEKSNSAAHTDANTDGKCDVCSANVPVPEHVCSFGTEWKSDDTNHWKECECGEKAESAAHADADVNGKCDVCSADVPLPPHEHTFSTEWSSDDDNHWNDCECGEKGNVAPHADEDLDGLCDECMHYVPLPPHEHDFGTGWMSDADNHWQACECGEKSGQAAHADQDKDGKCDTCDYIMETQTETGENALEIGSNAINKEDITYTYTAETDGTLTLTLVPPMISRPTSVFSASYTVNGGEAVALVDRTATDITLAKGDVVVIEVLANEAGSITAAWAGSAPVVTGNPLVIGNNAVNSEDITFVYTAETDGILTLTVKPPIFCRPTDVLDGTYSINGGEAVALVDNQATDITLKKGDVITIEVIANCSGTVTAAWVASAPVVTGNPLVIGDNAVNGEDITFVYTAETDGTLTLTVKPTFFSAINFVLDGTYSINGGEAVALVDNQATDITLKQGDVITVEVIANCSGTVTAAWAGSAPVVTGNTLALGTNAINSEDITFTYTAAEDGTLALTLKYPTYGKPTDVLQASYSVNGGEAVAFTYGQGFVTMKKGDVVTVEVVANCIASIEAVWTKATVEVTTTPLELGTNEVEGENITFEYEATEDGKLTLTAKPQATDNADASFSVTVSVNGGEATTLKNDAATEFTLKTGDVVVVTVTTNQSGSIEVTWTATPEEDDEPSSDIR